MHVLVLAFAIYFGVLITGFTLTHLVRVRGYRAFFQSREGGFYFSEEKVELNNKFENAMYIGLGLDVLLVAGLYFFYAMPIVYKHRDEFGELKLDLVFIGGAIIMLFLTEFGRRQYEKKHDIPTVLHGPRYENSKDTSNSFNKTGDARINWRVKLGFFLILIIPLIPIIYKFWYID